MSLFNLFANNFELKKENLFKNVRALNKINFYFWIFSKFMKVIKS